MKEKSFIVLTLLLFVINLQGQVNYDTIPKNEISWGGDLPDKLVIFKSFDKQLSKGLNYSTGKEIPLEANRVIVATTFTKYRTLKDTRILRSLNPYFDSIALNAVNNLNDWLPAMNRSKFVDLPFTFPIIFSNELEKTKKQKKSYDMLFKSTAKEYTKREEYFKFYNSKDETQGIINDFEYFTGYIADNLTDSCYTYTLEYDRSLIAKRKDRIKIELNNNDKGRLILINKNRLDLIFTTQSIKELYLKKNQDYILIGFKESETMKPEVTICRIKAVQNDNLTLDFKDYTLKDFKENFRQYFPKSFHAK